jgi:hypothetical protein
VNSLRKAALSLLISTLLFAGFSGLAFTGLFDLVETRFYNPAVVRAIDREIEADTQVIEEFFSDLQNRFVATLDEGAVRRSFLSNLESDDIAQRADLYGKLLESLGGLQSVRFVDSGGVRIHFSTWPPDMLLQDRNSIAYRNYNAAGNGAAYIPYGQVEAAAGPRLILDDAGERIVFSYPLKDSYDVYQGTALFSLSIRAVMDRMAAAGRIKIGEDVSVISEPPGIIIGLPAAGRNTLLPLVAQVWSENTLSLGRFNSGAMEAGLDLVSRRTNHNLYIGRLVNESLLTFPPAMRIILLVSFFVTAYLFIFLLFNLRQDDTTVIRSRLKKLQVNLLEEYYEQKGDWDWSRWKRELEQRREDIRSELKRGLRARSGDRAEIDNFIDRSWDDLMAIMGGQTKDRDGIVIDEDQLRTLLKRLLAESLAPPPPKAIAETPGPDFAPEPEAEEPEELEPLDETEAPDPESAPPLVAKAPEEPETPDKAEVLEPEPPVTEIPEEFEALGEAESPEALEPESAPPPVTEIPEEFEVLDEAEGPEVLEPESVPPPVTAAPEELETLDETENPEPEAGEPEIMMEFQEIDPLGFDMPGGPIGTALNNLASALEFTPDPEEEEREKDEAARSMTEHFEIQSPFAEIFSSLSEVAFEPEPMEDLENLENEGLEGDESPETEAEELERSFTGILFSIPFLTELNSEITVLEAEEEDASATAEDEGGKTPEEGEAGPVVEERDGVTYINESVLNPDPKTLKDLNRNFKNLIDSILHNT